MNKVEKIKAYLERRIAEITDISQGYIANKQMSTEYLLLFELLSYIDSLPDTEKDFSIKESVIPFGASDSELMHQEINIPEGFEATIEGNKIILKKTESEDEKVREYLIRYIDNTMKSSELKSKILAWLKNIPYTIDHEKREGFHLGYKAALEKQGESYTKRGVDDAYLKGISDAKNELEKQGEQKPAWSEEDEKMCQETIDWFEKKCFPYALESENPARESIKWLKSLKQRIGG